MEEESKNRLIPVTKWNDYHIWPPPGGLRHLVFYAGSNGFHKVIRRIGRRVLIDEAAFFKWVEERNPTYEQQLRRKGNRARRGVARY